MLFIRGTEQLYFLRKLRSFSVSSRMLQIFYQSVVESAVSSAVICWGSSIRASDLKKLNKLIKKAGSVLELNLQRRILNKMKTFMNNPEHPRHNKVSSVRGFFRSTATQTTAGHPSYPTIYNESLKRLKSWQLLQQLLSLWGSIKYVWVQHLDSSPTKPCSCDGCSQWFSIVLLKYARPPLKDVVCLGGYLVLKPLCTFQYWCCLSRCVSSSHHRHWRSPIPSEMQLLNCPLITSEMVRLLFSPQGTVFMIPKKNFKFLLIWPQNSFPFSLRPF